MTIERQSNVPFVDLEAEKNIISLAFQDFNYFSILSSSGINSQWFTSREASHLWDVFTELYAPPAMEITRNGIEKQVYKLSLPVEKQKLTLEFLEETALRAVPGSQLEREYTALLFTYQKRLEQQAASLLTIRANDPNVSIEESLFEMEKAISEIRKAATPFQVITAAQISQEGLEYYETVLNEDNSEEAMPYELKALNSATEGGMRRNELTLIKARRGVGKTSLAQREAYYQAVYHGKVVIYFSLEMSRRQWLSRVIQQETGISSIALQQGKFGDWKNTVFDKVKAFGETKLYMIDDPECNLEVVNRAMEFVSRKEGRIDIAVIDYAQLIEQDGPTEKDRNIRISKGLKKLKNKFDCHVVSVVKLSRNGEISESSQYDYDADNIWHLDNPLAIEKVPADRKTGPATIEIEKQRYGNAESADIWYHGQWARFTDPGTVLNKVSFRSDIPHRF